MRRRPGIAALENVVRGVSGQPRVVRTPRHMHRTASDSVSVHDRATATVSGTSIPSAEAWGNAVVTAVGTATVSGTSIPSAEAWGNAVVTAVGTATEHLTDAHRRPNVIAEVTLLLGGAGAGGWIAEHLVDTPGAGWVGAIAGLGWAWRLWQRHGPSADS